MLRLPAIWLLQRGCEKWCILGVRFAPYFGYSFGREPTSAASMTVKMGSERLLPRRPPALLNEVECVEWVGGARLERGSLRTCSHLSAGEHTSAATMTLMTGLDTLWCYGWEVCSWLVYAKTRYPFQLDVHVVFSVDEYDCVIY